MLICVQLKIFKPETLSPSFRPKEFAQHFIKIGSAMICYGNLNNLTPTLTLTLGMLAKMVACMTSPRYCLNLPPYLQ